MVIAKKIPPTSELIAFNRIMIARMMQIPKNINNLFFLVILSFT